MFSSNNTRADVLELYTSEGCSSCPPAEHWFGALRDSPRLWKDLIPAVFHVAYWDYLGWKDRFATDAFTARQRSIASSWRSGRVYTPGFVLNGAEWRGWFEKQSIPHSGNVDAGVLTVTIYPEKSGITYAPTQSGLKNLRVHLAQLAFDVSSHIRAGENRGRQLTHDFVVTAFTTVPLTPSGESFRAEAGKHAIDTMPPNRSAVAAWVTEVDRFVPLQAVGGWLEFEKRK